MTGAILVTTLAVLCAAGIFAAVLMAQRPEEGWRTWLRDTVRAWRREDFTWADEVDEEAAGGLGTLYLMSEPGNAYTSADEITGRLRELREHAPSLPEAGDGRPSEARA
ncbi:hypothetical protein AA0Y32_02965 [Georgenia phoenicis]|uniref:hypothetical protein n=1 Tax=unclassified Georgenia TaxID=2626815 RepID=UPI0039AEF49D